MKTLWSSRPFAMLMLVLSSLSLLVYGETSALPTNFTSDVQVVRVNRSTPIFPKPELLPHFSTSPKDSELGEVRLFQETLLPDDRANPITEENEKLAASLRAFAKEPSKLDGLAKFTSDYPNSRWTPAISVNLGNLYRDRGYFSKALACWKAAWTALKNSDKVPLQALADRACADRAELLSRFGRYEELKALYEEIDGRKLHGSAAERISRAREGLASMEDRPEKSFLCGPLALSRVRSALNLQADPRIENAESSSQGTSLSQIADIANQSGMSMRIVRRSPGAAFPLPCVVHWKVGHFGALIRKQGNHYLLQDLTFKHDLWIEEDALESEASGYFLINAEELSDGLVLAGRAEGDSVWGRGNAGAGNSDHSEDPLEDDDCGERGMVTYSIYPMVLGFSLSDIPVGYSPPRGPAINFRATYHQREANQPANMAFSNLGRNWSHNWMSWIDIKVGAKGVARVYRTDATVEEFVSEYADDREYAFTGNYLPNRDSGAVLSKISDTHYVRKLPNGASQVFNLPAPGGILFLTEIRDPAGNAAKLTFDESFRLRAITDAIGQVTTFEYELAGDPLKITRVIDPFGRFAIFHYEAGVLVKITDVIGMSSEFLGGASVSAFKTPYGVTRFEIEEDSRGHYRYLTVTDPKGGREVAWFIGFNSNSRRPEVDEPNFIPDGMRGNARELSGRNTFFFSKKATAEGADVAGDASKALILHWMHAKDNQSVSHLLESQKPPLSARIFFNYDDQQFGKDTTIRSSRPTAIGRTIDLGPRGTHKSQASFFSYNPLGNLLQTTDPLGRQQRFDYATNLIDVERIWRKGAADWELLSAYSWNSQHLPLTVTDAAGQSTDLGYNPFGQLNAVTNALKQITSLQYDEQGYLRQVIGPNPTAIHGFTYDGFGRVHTVTDSEGYSLTYEYDALDRLTKVLYPDGTFEFYTYDRMDNDKTRDRNGRWTRTRYNELRQPEEIVDPSNRTNILSWCGCGSLEAITDARGRITRWDTDARGRLRSKTYHDQSTVGYEYEPDSGRLKVIRDAKRQETHFAYNLDDSIASITFSNAVVATPTVSFIYDPYVNRLLTMRDGIGETRYEYYPIERAPSLGADWLKSIDGPLTNDTVVYRYDELGRATNRAIGGVDATVTFDALNRPREVQNALGAFAYEYVRATRRLDSIAYPNGQRSRFEYYESAKDQRLKQILHLRPDGSTLSRHQYTYDAAGIIQTWTQQVDENAPEESSFDYDSSYQLTGGLVREPSGKILRSYGYRYDQAGNRTGEQRGSWISSAAADNLNQLKAVSPGGLLAVRGKLDEAASVVISGVQAQMRADAEFTADIPVDVGTNLIDIVAKDGSGNAQTNSFQLTVTGPEGSTLGFDLSGNCTNRVSASGSVSYEWDAANRLVAVVAGSHRSEFFYDGLGRRIRIAENEDGTIVRDRYFVWCGLEICEERNASGEVLQRFFAHGVQRPGGDLFYSRDHLGSIRELTDQNGVLRARWDYDAYGRTIRTIGETDADFGFTGHFLHTESGLVLAPFRVLDPGLGRWLSRDPLGEADNFNNYIYALNSPVSFNDPLGLLSEKEKANIVENAISFGAGLGLITGGYLGPGAGAAAGFAVAGPGGGYVGAGAGAIAGPAIGAGVGGVAGLVVGSAVVGALDLVSMITGGEGSGGASDGSGQHQPLSPGEIKKMQKGGVDPHDLKPNSKYDLFKDRKGNICVKPKNGDGPGEPTGYNINEF